MTGWLIYDKIGKARNKAFIQSFLTEAEERKIELIFVLDTEVKEHLDNKERPSFAIVRTIAPDLTIMLESIGIPCYNNSQVSYMCNHKGRTIQFVENLNSIRCIPTKTCQREELNTYLGSKNTVLKSVDGHGGKEVFLATDEISKIQSGIKGDFVVQPLIEGLGIDVRVYVLGQTILGAVKRMSKEGFRANYSLGGEIEWMNLTKEQEQWVMDIVHTMKFDLIGIDFIVDKNNAWWFNEIEDVVGARMLYQLTDINLTRQYLSYIKQEVEKE